MVLRFPKLKIFQQWWGIPLLVFALAIILPGVFFYAHPVNAEASISGLIWYSLSNIFEWLSGFATSVLLWLIGLLIYVSGYNNFINAKVVQVGWPLVRDVANMFYILVMLVMAFATMLKIEKYSMKALLPRLILTAILVNFSKTIIGLIIDFGQVIMLTFVNGYAATAGGNFVQMFGLEAMTKLRSDKGILDSPAQLGVLASFFLAFICISISMIVVGIFVVVLLARIIVLWILIVLSPIAFLLGTFPKGQDYYGKWWKELINNVISGPIVAFFLWLSLAVFGGGNMGSAELKAGNAVPANSTSEAAQYAANLGLSQAGALDSLTTFAVSIAMLLMGLSQISELGVAGAGLASGAMSTMKSMATKAVKRAVVPAALIAGGAGIPMALAKMSILKGGMDIAAKMPVIGKTMTGFRKAATEYVGESGKLEQKFGIPAAGLVAKFGGLYAGSIPAIAAAATFYGGGAAVGAVGKIKKVHGAMQGIGGAAEGLGKSLEQQTEDKGLKGRFLRAVGAGHLARGIKGAGESVREQGEEMEALPGYKEAVIKGVMGGYAVYNRSTDSAVTRARTDVIANERNDERKGSTNMREEQDNNVVDIAFRDPAVGDAKDRETVYAARIRALKVKPIKKIAMARDPEQYKKMVEELPAFADTIGNGEEARKEIKEAKKNNLSLNSTELIKNPKTGLISSEMRDAVIGIHPRNIKNVDLEDLENPDVARFITPEQSAAGMMSGPQLVAYNRGLAKANAAAAGAAARAAAVPTPPAPPLPRPYTPSKNAKREASRARKEAKKKKSTSEFSRLSPDDQEDHIAYTPDPNEVMLHTGFTQPQLGVSGDRGSFAPGGQKFVEDAVARAGATGEMPDFLKNLKAEAVFSTEPNMTIEGLSAMTQALVKNATVSQILALRTKDMSEDQNKLAAALHLAMIGKLSSEGNITDAENMRSWLDTPRYADIKKHATVIEDEINNNGGTFYTP